MNFTVEEKLFVARFQSEVAAQFPTIPVDYIGSRASAENGYLIRFRVRRASAANVAIGGGVRRNYGSVLIQIVAPANKGSEELLRIADTAASAFANWRANNGKIKFRASSLMGPDDDGALIVGTVDIPFQSEYSV